MKSFSILVFSATCLPAIMYAQSADGASPTLLINEVMQSNIDAWMLSGDYPDSWVEIYNPTDQDINMRGYGIGPSEDIAEAYIMPMWYNVPAHGCQLIPCDKRNQYQHTHFRLESTDAGELYLFGAAGQVTDHLCYPAMPAPNVAYGRVGDGADVWQYELQPTPGEANCGGGSSQVLPDPKFSIKGRLMSEPADLEITLPVTGNLPEDTRLYVTLNGEEPAFESPSYTRCSIHLDRTTTVRAKLLSAGALPSRSVTHSYIFHPREIHIPVVSLVTDSAHLYSEDYGILLGGVPSGTGNFYKDWRRPLNIEYFEPDEQAATINQLAETEVGGVGSRIYSQKTLKLYANKRFGKKRFKGNLWPQDKPWLTKVKSMKLRNGGNRCLDTRFEDALVQRIFGHWVEGMEYQAYQAVVGYINGKYAGIYGMRERANEDYLESNLGIDSDSIEVCENFTSPAPEYAELLAVIHDESSTLADFDALMDVEGFANYMCCEFYASNEDFPHNNVYMWRQTGPGQKWHFMLKDLDYFSVSSLGFNYMNWLMAEGSEGQWAPQPAKHALIQRMMRMAEFRDLFLDKMSAMLGDFLQPTVTVPLVNQMREEIEGEIEATFATFAEEVSPAEFATKIEQRLIPYCQQRPLSSYKHLSRYFGLGEVVPMTIENADFTASLNGVGLTQSLFDGYAWSDRHLSLDSGDDNRGWILLAQFADGLDQTYTFPHRSVSIVPGQDFVGCQRLSFTPLDIDCSIGRVEDDPTQMTKTVYSLDGIRRNGLSSKLSIVRYADGRVRIVL